MCRRRRAAGLLGGAVAVLVVTAPPAAADPARPGNVRSEVLAVDPPSRVFTLSVEGGDAFLHLAVARGHEVLVVGYQGEPFLRVDSDGTVSENLTSPSLYLSRDRYAGTRVPEAADPKADPRWQPAGRGGTVTWHDHRIHWMGAGDPPVAETSWEVPLLVDGAGATARGRYVRLDPPSPWPWLAVAVVLTVAGLALVRRRQPAAWLAAATVAVVLPVTAGALRAPGGTSGAVTAAALAALAGATAAGSILAARVPIAAASLGAGSGVALLLWALLRFDVLTHAVLVSGLPEWWDRGVTVLAAAAGVVLVVASVRSLLAATTPAAAP
ncbi:MAG TPA: hypothetical protein VF855_11510 [Acidimicrobiales bacterium]